MIHFDKFANDVCILICNRVIRVTALIHNLKHKLQPADLHKTIYHFILRKFQLFFKQ